MTESAYLWFKAVHIVGVVVWFAGLFYLVRLFIYHVEAEQEPEPARTPPVSAERLKFSDTLTLPDKPQR